jgi:hypothetical protein
MPTPEEHDAHAGGIRRRTPGLYARNSRSHHTQLAEDCRALNYARKWSSSNGGRNEHCQLFGSTSPTGPREERALKDLAFFGECHLEDTWLGRLWRWMSGAGLQR